MAPLLGFTTLALFALGIFVAVPLAMTPVVMAVLWLKHRRQERLAAAPAWRPATLVAVPDEMRPARAA